MARDFIILSKTEDGNAFSTFLLLLVFSDIILCAIEAIRDK